MTTEHRSRRLLETPNTLLPRIKSAGTNNPIAGPATYQGQEADAKATIPTAPCTIIYSLVAQQGFLEDRPLLARGAGHARSPIRSRARDYYWQTLPLAPRAMRGDHALRRRGLPIRHWNQQPVAGRGRRLLQSIGRRDAAARHAVALADGGQRLAACHLMHAP